jgi:hypothetical protein
VTTRATHRSLIPVMTALLNDHNAVTVGPSAVPAAIVPIFGARSVMSTMIIALHTAVVADPDPRVVSICCIC